MSHRTQWIAVAVLALAVAGCSDSGDDSDAAPTATPDASSSSPEPSEDTTPTASAAESSEDGAACLSGEFSVVSIEGKGELGTSSLRGGDWSMSFDGKQYTMKSGGKGPVTVTVAVGTGQLSLKGTVQAPYYETDSGAVSFRPFPKVKGKIVERSPGGTVSKGDPQLFGPLISPSAEMNVSCTGDDVTLTSPDITLELTR